MSQQRPIVYVLGAGCSVDYCYPLAKDFLGELKKYRTEQLLGDDSRQLRQAADKTIELMEKSRSSTIDRLLRIIDEDWHEPGRSLRPYDPSRPPYCRIEGGPFEIPLKHAEQVNRVTRNARVITAAMWLHNEQRAHESDLRGYHELFETIFPNLNWREALGEARCHVLTFNYDRLFEMAFLRRYPQFDPNQFPLYGPQVLNSGLDASDRHKKIGFAQDRFCFLKLHGSAGMWVRPDCDQVEHSCGVPRREPGLRINDTHFYTNPRIHRGRPTLKAEPLIVLPHEKKNARPESGTKPLYGEYISKAYWGQAHGFGV